MMNISASFWQSATSGSEHASTVVTRKILPKIRVRPALVFNLMKSTVLVEMRSDSGLFIGRRPAFQVDRRRVQVVIDKIVRGLFFREMGVRLSDDARVADYIFNPRLESSFQEAICSLEMRDVSDGRVFSYRCLVSEEIPEVSFWFMMFYEQVFFVTQTQPSSAGVICGSEQLGSVG